MELHAKASSAGDSDVPSQPWEVPASEKKAPVSCPLCGRATS